MYSIFFTQVNTWQNHHVYSASALEGSEFIYMLIYWLFLPLLVRYIDYSLPLLLRASLHSDGKGVRGEDGVGMAGGRGGDLQQKPPSMRSRG